MLSLLHSKGPAITLFITLSGRNKLKILDKSLKKKSTDRETCSLQKALIPHFLYAGLVGLHTVEVTGLHYFSQFDF